MCKKKDILRNQFLVKKAKKSACTYRISAIAFDKKGNVIGHSRNAHSVWNVIEKIPEGRAGTGIHAERALMERYRGVVKTIVICRVGHGGKLRHIDPCPTCQKVAEKYGVKIVSISSQAESETARRHNKA